MNVRPPGGIDANFLKVQNEYLQAEVSLKGITDLSELCPIDKEIYLWQGDITTLSCDAIVNAANSQMLGCFCPCHGCIDNAIHTYAGVELRLECAEIMKKQGHAEPTGKAKITKAYNLPCKYVLHTVGPIISDKPSEHDEQLLASCYLSCLKLADENKISSIAFCCISTGEFHFSNDRAAEIAVQTVKQYKEEKPNEAYLTEKGIENIKSNLAKVIFRQDLISIYQKQTEHRDKLRAEARDIVEDLVSKIDSEIYISASVQHKLLELADRLSMTRGKKVYGYLKPDVKAIVDSIVDELANDDRIKKLYDLWYEQKENTIRTYTDEIPDRIPLVDNNEFKSIKNAVIKEALKLNLPEDELEENENADEETFLNLFEYEENTYDESTLDSNKGVLYPYYSIRTNRNSVAVSSLYLLRYLCNMIQSQLRFEKKQKVQRTDKKLKQKIDDKKTGSGVENVSLINWNLSIT